MASTYPGQLDIFPGAPYQDNIEFVLAAYANAWIGAILAVEQTIGAGTGSSTQNPLYSAAYGQMYSTLAARLSAAESAVKSGAQLDQADDDIQTVGQKNIAGANGKSTDSGHVHQGVSGLTAGSGMRVIGGDGSGHGALTISPVPTVTGHTYAVAGPVAVPSGGANYIPPFFEPVGAGTTKTLLGLQYVIRAGTSVTFSIYKNGSPVSGLTNLAASTSPFTTTLGSPLAVSNGDEFALIVSAVNGSPDNLSATFYFKTGT